MYDVSTYPTNLIICTEHCSTIRAMEKSNFYAGSQINIQLKCRIKF